MTCTGWTWKYIDEHVTLPQVEALSQFWIHTPPPAIQLRRIARFVGLPEPKTEQPKKRTLQEDLRELAGAGMPVFKGKPDDPMLDFLDL